MSKLARAAAVLAALIGPVGASAGDDFDPPFDFGQFRDSLLRAHARQLFGVTGPLSASSTATVDAATAEANPTSLVTVARSLRVRVVNASKELGANVDQMVLWPNDVAPTHLILCNEEGADKPGVQRVGLADGKVETILTGTVSCDPVRVTPWGTVIVAEEAGSDGWLLEIINPLKTTGVVFDRASGNLSGSADASNVATRPAPGRLSWEGIALYPNGVMYYGDENRPSKGIAGGAYFKFIPDTLWSGGGSITNLADSPIVSGKVYGLRLGKRSNSDYGQGTNTGLGTWIDVVAEGQSVSKLRTAAVNLKLTGYYRPEDADIDRNSLAQGKVRFCANNTGNELTDRNWGETICATDGSLEEAAANTATPEVQFFVLGSRDFAMMDNIAYQPGRGNWIIHEDGDGPASTNPNRRNNDLWACLEDGPDADAQTDGCIRVATLNDLHGDEGAEWTGGVFDATGTRFFVSVQHNVTGHGVILEISGWR